MKQINSPKNRNFPLRLISCPISKWGVISSWFWFLSQRIMCCFFKTYKAMKEALISAEAVDYLDFNPEISGTDVTLLGLKADRLYPNDANKMVKISIDSAMFTFITFRSLKRFELVICWAQNHSYFEFVSFPKMLQQGIIPELENRLKSKCEEIAQYHEASKSKGTWYLKYTNHLINCLRTVFYIICILAVLCIYHDFLGTWLHVELMTLKQKIC